MTEGFTGFAPGFHIRPMGQLEEHRESMFTIFTWVPLSAPPTPPGQFVPVAGTLEKALLHGHLDLGQHARQFGLVSLEVSGQAWASWAVQSKTAQKRHRPLTYLTGTLTEALAIDAVGVWICRDSIYRETPLGQAHRLDYRKPYYQLLKEGGPATTFVVHHEHSQMTVQLAS